jgi:hypothetical protein
MSKYFTLFCFVFSANAFASDCKELAERMGFVAGAKSVSARVKNLGKQNLCLVYLGHSKEKDAQDHSSLQSCLNDDADNALLNAYLSSYQNGVAQQVHQVQYPCSMIQK